VQGRIPASVRIGYVYRLVPLNAGELVRAFGYSGGKRISGGRPQGEITFWQEHQVMVGIWNIGALGLGGWGLDIHHGYVPAEQRLVLGDGGQRRGQDVSEVIRTLAGTGTGGHSGDGGAATAAQLAAPNGVAVDGQGVVYVTDSPSNRVRKSTPRDASRRWRVRARRGTVAMTG
jgi:hypothetical protein